MPLDLNPLVPRTETLVADRKTTEAKKMTRKARMSQQRWLSCSCACHNPGRTSNILQVGFFRTSTIMFIFRLTSKLSGLARGAGQGTTHRQQLGKGSQRESVLVRHLSNEFTSFYRRSEAWMRALK